MSKVVGSSVPESWKARRSAATESSSSGWRSSSALTLCPGTKQVTRQGGSSVMAATFGAMPSSAAAFVAMRSASRSMPSAFVFLPGKRTT